VRLALGIRRFHRNERKILTIRPKRGSVGGQTKLGRLAQRAQHGFPDCFSVLNRDGF
jgi:hypothetical protein